MPYAQLGLLTLVISPSLPPHQPFTPPQRPLHLWYRSGRLLLFFWSRFSPWSHHSRPTHLPLSLLINLACSPKPSGFMMTEVHFCTLSQPVTARARRPGLPLAAVSAAVIISAPSASPPPLLLLPPSLPTSWSCTQPAGFAISSDRAS